MSGPRVDKPAATRGLRARPAAAIAGVVAVAAAGAGWYASPDAPWWIYPFLGAVGFLVVFRLLRPPTRRPGWEDEL